MFENKHLLVIDKPSGLAVHSGTGVAFGIIDVMRKLRPDCDMELVHRLDRDTSGCLILAKHRQSLLVLQRCVQDNSISRYYKTPLTIFILQFLAVELIQLSQMHCEGLL